MGGCYVLHLVKYQPVVLSRWIGASTHMGHIVSGLIHHIDLTVIKRGVKHNLSSVWVLVHHHHQQQKNKTKQKNRTAKKYFNLDKVQLHFKLPYWKCAWKHIFIRFCTRQTRWEMTQQNGCDFGLTWVTFPPQHVSTSCSLSFGRYLKHAKQRGGFAITLFALELSLVVFYR